METAQADKTLKPGRYVRALVALDQRGAIDQEARTVELAFASEEPYERWWGVEILDLSPQSVRLGRLASGGPLLMDHDSRDHVGVIESVRLDADRVGRAVVRFGRSQRAEEVFNDVKDGIRRNVSVGYMIHKAVLQEESDGLETYRVSDWEPMEISLVSVPADPTVGIGRSAEDDPRVTPARGPAKTPASQSENRTMSDINVDELRAASAAEARAAEQKRVNEIIAIGESCGLEKLAAEHVRSQSSVEEFQAAAIKALAARPKPTPDIGLTQKEARRFSFVRAIAALSATGPDIDATTKRRVVEAARFELECSRAVAERLGKDARGIFVPHEVQQRDLTVGTATAGGHTVSTDLLSASFIDLLRNRMMVMNMGAQMLDGLVGNIAIPRQTGGATAYWVAESGAPTESQQAFDQVTMSPNTVGAFTDLSRKLLLQSSIGVEAFVRNDLATILALAIDLAAINGSGASNQPTGILNTSGIGDVAGGTNGLAPTWAHIVELETDVSVANADVGSLGYLTNAKVRGKLKTTEQFASTNGMPVWKDGDTPLNGYRAGVTNQVPSNLTKGSSSGVCSAIIFGNFADLIIGHWGTLDLMVDPYSNSTSGTVRVVALQDVDVVVRHAESFSAMQDALTA